MSVPAATIAANRFGLGARPGDIAAMSADPRGALRAQLEGGPPLLSAAGLPDSASLLAQVAELRQEKRQGEAALKLGQLYRPVYVEEVRARLQQGVTTDRPFTERLVQFWSNHFAVSVDKAAVLGLAGSLEREAIRPNVLGSFGNLLLAVEQHPAMLLYLDNARSIGPHSALALRAERRAQRLGNAEQKLGLNENLAREILELHTLGVNGGYSQGDVTEFAKVITGWSIGGGQGQLRSGTPGRFQFRDNLHEPGARVLLGRRYGESGLAQGTAVLHDLAQSPQTARHLATKLARHFIADDPPSAAVERLTQAYLDSRGDLPTVYRALIDAPQAWAVPLAKFKTPSDFVYSSFRALQAPVPEAGKALVPFELLGQRVYSPGSPAGWPDTSADWDGSSSLFKRLEWADQIGQRLGSRIDAGERAADVLAGVLGADTRTAIAHADSGAQALTLMLASPEFMRR
ncbi:MAG TPA: DUF1800 domain-containing protein [Steroidobacteraceae bacterium]|nr:DUF1800 domain-containing protein [Steroidobacteraceae bacterium]